MKRLHIQITIMRILMFCMNSIKLTNFVALKNEYNILEQRVGPNVPSVTMSARVTIAQVNPTAQIDLTIPFSGISIKGVNMMQDDRKVYGVTAPFIIAPHPTSR